MLCQHGGFGRWEHFGKDHRLVAEAEAEKDGKGFRVWNAMIHNMQEKLLKRTRCGECIAIKTGGCVPDQEEAKPAWHGRKCGECAWSEWPFMPEDAYVSSCHIRQTTHATAKACPAFEPAAPTEEQKT